MRIDYPERVYYRKPLAEVDVDALVVVDWLSQVQSAAIVLGALSEEWADFRLERRNDLSGKVAARLRQRGSEWNACARAFAGFFQQHLRPRISQKLDSLGLPPELLDVIRWDIVSYMQELNYTDVCPLGFYERLWHVYRTGRFPCGWAGEYPSGMLIIA